MMDNMKELYEKVAKDEALQAKLNAILKDAEQAGEAATKDKLAAFAKEAGFDVTLDEMQDFFKKMVERKEGELSEMELDMVAGGKSALGIFAVMESVATIGISCGGVALTSKVAGDVLGDCNRVYN